MDDVAQYPQSPPPPYEALHSNAWTHQSYRSDGNSEVSTQYEMPRNPLSLLSAQSMQTYSRAVERGAFGSEVEQITGQYETLPMGDIRKTHFRQLSRCLGAVVYRKHDTNAGSSADSTFQAYGVNPTHLERTGLLDDHNTQIRALLNVQRIAHDRDRRAIGFHLRALTDVVPLPIQASFEVRLRCDQWKRRVHHYRIWWAEQQKDTILGENGERLCIFLAFLLECLAADKHTWEFIPRALRRAVELNTGPLSARLPMQNYANIVSTLADSYIYCTFIHRRRFPTKKEAYSYAGSLFCKYAEHISRLSQHYHGNLSEIDYCRDYDYILRRMDPCARAAHFYASLRIAWDYKWSVQTHLELLCHYMHTFAQAELAFAALSFIALKLARVEPLRELYISACVLSRALDCDLWDKAWNDTLVRVLPGEAD